MFFCLGKRKFRDGDDMIGAVNTLLYTVKITPVAFFTVRVFNKKIDIVQCKNEFCFFIAWHIPRKCCCAMPDIKSHRFPVKKFID
jgi:hypothetical protein